MSLRRSRDIRILILPIILYVLEIACGGILIVIDIKYAHNPSGHVAAEWLYNSATEAGLGIAVFLNCLVTALITWKIWWVRRQVVRMLERSGGTSGSAQAVSYKRVVLVLVENRAMYGLAQAAYLAAVLSRSVRTKKRGIMPLWNEAQHVSSSM